MQIRILHSSFIRIMPRVLARGCSKRGGSI